MFKQLKHFSVALAIASTASGAAALDLPVKTVNGKQYYYYRIQPKETIYSLTNKLGINRGDIVKYNPSAADGLRAGDTLYFPTSEFDSTKADNTSQQAVNGRLTYKVSKGETLYSIAKRHNVTTERLTELNPSVRDGLKAGSILVIYDGSETPQPQVEDPSVVLPDLAVNGEPVPAPQFHEPEPVMQSGNLRDIPSQTAHIPRDIPNTFEIVADSIATADSDTICPAEDSPRYNGRIDIAVMLPFMLDEPKISKQAQLYTDFYKGLLMAVDTLRSSETPIHIHAYDTAGNPDTVEAILSRPEMDIMDVIIAPEDSAQIESIAQFADGTNATIINMFAVKNNSYLQHPCLVNANIPHELMYEKAISNFISRFDGYTPVLLVNREGDGDKKAFVDAMRKKLTADSIEYHEVAYSGSLRPDDIGWMEPDRQYVFVPSSGSRAELLRLLPSMLEKRNSMADPDNVRLFGYPEWIILRGDVAQKLHQMNAVIYSRFVSDPDNYRTRHLERRFQEWYGSPMTPTAPMQGTLGYDMGMWILKALTSTPGEDLGEKNFVYHGLQSGFDLIRQQAHSGLINESLYFIYFLPDGQIDKVVL
ncbi:MAG: LysM peptidoglycan-binding domain-containing protein [Muribaculaceae bacterium]|nr:LysM peptidoglycan-binding domain-containing protein [Muribaculaceae bacterium]